MGEHLKGFRFIILISLLVIAAMACNFSGLRPDSSDSEAGPNQEGDFSMPTMQPTPTAQSCLINTWEIPGLSDYVLAAIPPDLAEQYQLRYKDTSGHIYVTFSPDGKMKLQADQLRMLFDAKVSLFRVEVAVTLDGTAVGSYVVNGSTLTTSNVDTRALSASASAMGQDLMDAQQIIGAVPLLQAPYNSAEFSCQGSTLQLKMLAYPDSMPPLVFSAVK